MNIRTPRIAAAGGTAIAVLLLMAAAPPSEAQEASSTPDDLRIPDGPISAQVDAGLLTATGSVTVALELADPSLAEAVGENAVQDGPELTSAQQRSHVNELASSQRALLDRIAPLGAEAVTTTQVASNLVVVEVDASQVLELAQQPGVTNVVPVGHREVDLSETVPYVGAAELQADPGLTGEGIDIAVIDTGIDYTHARFGGPGTQAAYEAAYGTSVTDPANTTRDGLFPTDKVVEGFDFIGELWEPEDSPELVPDPDPIDCGPSGTPPPCTGGHGTHVASIAAGDTGVAPGARLYAYKVCSSVSNACADPAILQALDAALDPNGDGNIADAVDVINLSLGINYGQIEDVASGAVANAVRMGVTVVAAAGNDADKPYIVGGSSSTPEVISVAQTHVPSAINFALRVTEPAEIADVYRNTATVEWAPVTDGFEGPLRYSSAVEGQRLGCFVDEDGNVVDENGNPFTPENGVSPYPADFFAGQVALIDRGTCNISFKVHNAAEAGAIGVVIANNVPGEAPSFSFGGPDPFTPQQTVIVGQEIGNTLKGPLASGTQVVVVVDPADATPLVGSMVSTSSRGPSSSEVAIKPDIGAPGASVSAEAGTGTGETGFGGTSGASPMVAGAAALLLEAYPDRTPLEIKAVLMNTAETEVFINPATRPGELAEITRIGGGELRVDNAFHSTTAAWSREDRSAGLSFGFHTVTRPTVLRKDVTIRNYGNRTRTYELASSFRYPDDAATGAVRLVVQPRVSVRPGRSVTVPVYMWLDPSKLPAWVLDGGANGANGPLLQSNEFDGYLTVTGGGDQVHLPWHVLPHRASNVVASSEVRLRDGTATARLFNATLGGPAALGEAFALTGTSPRIPDSELPGEGDNFAVVDLAAAGVRTLDRADPACDLPPEIPGNCLQFGVNTFGEHSHPNAPGELEVLIDVDRDGTDDFLVFNRDLTLGLDDGRNVVWINEIGTEAVDAFFFTETNLNSANTILTVPEVAVGLAAGTQFDFTVHGADWYFPGTQRNEPPVVTDTIDTMTFTVGQPRFATEPRVEVPPLGSAGLAITEVEGGAAASPSQSGVLLLWRDGRQGAEAATIRVR